MADRARTAEELEARRLECLYDGWEDGSTAARWRPAPDDDEERAR